MSRRDDHANVLCLGARQENDDEVTKLTGLWLNTPPEGGRHDRRVNRILEIEQEIHQLVAVAAKAQHARYWKLLGACPWLAQ